MDDLQKPLRIGVANAEGLIFENSEVWPLIPEMRRFRDQWAISRMNPALRPTGVAAIIDFLATAGEEEEYALSSYFGRIVTIDNPDRRCVANVEFDASTEQPELEEMSAYTGFGCFRKANRVYITFWR